MIKIIIACDNDSILLNKLTNITTIELKHILIKENIIIETYRNTLPDMLILEFKNETHKKKIMKKISKLNFNKHLIISATNLRTYLCFNQLNTLVDLIKNFENLDDISKLEKNILDMLWKLRFNLYSKGTNYIKDAIILAYFNNSLLYDSNKLMKEIANLYNLDEKNVRNNMDNALNLAFNYENLQYDIQFFKGYYDGRKVSLKYFIVLAVHYINIEMNSNFPKILEMF